MPKVNPNENAITVRADEKGWRTGEYNQRPGAGLHHRRRYLPGSANVTTADGQPRTKRLSQSAPKKGSLQEEMMLEALSAAKKDGAAEEPVDESKKGQQSNQRSDALLTMESGDNGQNVDIANIVRKSRADLEAEKSNLCLDVRMEDIKPSTASSLVQDLSQLDLE
jgi:hypothetical protein